MHHEACHVRLETLRNLPVLHSTRSDTNVEKDLPMLSRQTLQCRVDRSYSIETHDGDHVIVVLRKF